MSYHLIFDDKALGSLEKLPQLIKKRIFRKLQSTKEDPFHFFIRLEGRPDYKLRIGDYRIIAEILEKEIQILVLYVGHRKNIYKNL
jgi:mRNA interferase RelE/StbE